MNSQREISENIKVPILSTLTLKISSHFQISHTKSWKFFESKLSQTLNIQKSKIKIFKTDFKLLEVFEIFRSTSKNRRLSVSKRIDISDHSLEKSENNRNLKNFRKHGNYWQFYKYQVLTPGNMEISKILNLNFSE